MRRIKGKPDALIEASLSAILFIRSDWRFGKVSTGKESEQQITREDRVDIGLNLKNDSCILAVLPLEDLFHSFA